MLLGAALQELKTMQSKLTRLYNLRSDTFNYLENREFEVDFNQITEDINKLVDQIRQLKVQIAKTNSNFNLKVNGKEISIQELIFLIGDLRSDLSQMSYLKPRGPVYLGGQAVEYIPQKRQDQIAELISEIEEKKADLDKLLQAKNWSTELND
ncbi:hypothetical protein LCGC14_0640680 [marine sediment metagenome]|uniref:Septicolysin n=1 Tax=marine sediment metagenome TaxID=412755 RepID=A0A0F9U7K9_9ZZZZ|nr:MAG: hypothetical protein Lokiarch_05010 [Candidatus Lokiarchaeum sp. GC14_75]